MEVTEQIIEKTPKEHKLVFEELLNHFRYQAPEQYPDCFHQLFKAIGYLIATDNNNDGTPIKAWQWKIAAIIGDKAVAELKNIYGVK